MMSLIQGGVGAGAADGPLRARKTAPDGDVFLGCTSLLVHPLPLLQLLL